MIRVGPRGTDAWKRISWSEAIDTVSARIRKLRESGSPGKVAAIDGNQSRSSVALLVRRLLDAVGSPNYIALTGYEDTYAMAQLLMQGSGGPLALDLENSDFVLSFGCGLLDGWGAPGRMLYTWGEWVSREDKDRPFVVQVDPGASDTAMKADLWIAPFPGTEAALALGIAHVLVREKAYHKEFIDNYSIGFTDWVGDTGVSHKGFSKVVLERYAPQVVETITGVKKELIIRVARRFAAAEAPVAIAGRKIENPVEPNPMIRDILPPYTHYSPGSFRNQNGTPCPPDIITINTDGSTSLDWDIEEILIDQSWIVEFEVTSSLDGHVPVGMYPDSRVNYTNWDNKDVSTPFPDTFVNVLIPEPVNPPNLVIDTDQNDVRLHWTTPGANISHYLIYRALDQREFDFANPYNNTLTDSDNGVIPTRTSWNDTGAASSDLRECYYVIRAVTDLGIKSPTSNTVGKWTKSFDSGMNTFSLPLEPIEEHSIVWYADSIPNTVYIDWMNDTGRWVRQWRGGPITRTDQVRMGEGFEIYLSASTTFTFVGSPASMIKYREGLGDSLAFREGLIAGAFQDNVRLYWKAALGASGYRIYRSEDRTGLHDTSLGPIVTVNGTFWKDLGAMSQSTSWYYMVVPLYEGGKEGSSTYSIGILTMEYQSGSDTFALPLEPEEVHSLDWYCDNIPNVVGIIYLMKGYWRLHAREMPEGVYDFEATQSEGYQISFSGSTTRFTFIGH